MLKGKVIGHIYRINDPNNFLKWLRTAGEFGDGEESLKEIKVSAHPNNKYSISTDDLGSDEYGSFSTDTGIVRATGNVDNLIKEYLKS